jgi:hypothetical protein
MKLPIFLSVSVLVTSSFLVACSSTTPDSSSSAAPASDVIPELDVSASTLDCEQHQPGADSIIFLRQTADLIAGDVQYRVATFGCGALAEELGIPASDGTSAGPVIYGSEVVEAFVLENGAWTSVGLASGPDIEEGSVPTPGEDWDNFVTSGACASDNTTITCPAYSDYEYGMRAEGRIEITQQGSGLVWTFVTEKITELEYTDV